MKKLSSFFMAALVAMSWVSCNDTDGFSTKHSAEVTFTSNLQSTTITKVTDSSWEDNDRIGVYMVNAGDELGDAGLAEGVANYQYVTLGDGNFTPINDVNKIYLPIDGANVDFVSYYPYTADVTAYTYSVDVSDQSNPAAIDLLYSSNATGKNQSESTVHLIFNHQLSKVVFNIINTGSAGDVELDGLVASISELNTTADFSLVTAEFTNEGNPAKVSANVTLSADKRTAKAEALVIPESVDGNTLFIFTYANKEYKFSPVAHDMESGKKYIYEVDLKLAATQPEIEAEIVDWDEEEKPVVDLNGPGDKQTYFPKSVWNVNSNNDYFDINSQFNIYRMKTTENLTFFWEAGYGEDPANASDADLRIPIHDIMQEADKMFVFYRDELKFVQAGSSISDTNRMVAYFYDDKTEGTVYGGGVDGYLGAMWIYPSRVKSGPYGAIAHELGHSFQSQMNYDGHYAFQSGGAIFEMTSQYMLWQYYPTWIVFENYHFQTFMGATHLAFLHNNNMYCSPFVLEYWAHLHGKDIVAKVWRESERGDDAVMSYQRATGITQEQFNDEIFDGARRFITWDMDRVREVSAPYANMHTSALDAIGDDWYQIASARCIENYGYNGIRLDVPAAGTEVVLDFKGVAGAAGFNAVNVDKAGWRYGFLAVKSNGERVYGSMYSDAEGQAHFTVPLDTEYLWLVVSGAPTEHWVHNSRNIEKWPYQIKLTGTNLHESVIN